MHEEDQEAFERIRTYSKIASIQWAEQRQYAWVLKNILQDRIK
jgi:hypothetical protein